MLVIRRESGAHQAWTGSHRIGAARAAGLESIPAYVVRKSRIARFGVDAVYGHVEDYDRLELMRKVGGEDAVRLMWLEGRE